MFDRSECQELASGCSSGWLGKSKSNLFRVP